MTANQHIRVGATQIRDGLIHLAKGVAIWTCVVVGGLLTLVAIL